MGRVLFTKHFHSTLGGIPISRAYIQHKRIRWDRRRFVRDDDIILAEEPLAIRVQGAPYAMVMRTPGDEIAHAAGFCLAEGIVDEADDLKELALCNGPDSNVVTVTLSAQRRGCIDDVLERRAFISQTSCGVCGKEIVDDLNETICPIVSENRLNLQAAYECLINLSKHQPLRRQTRASHAAALFNANLDLLAAAEDVGRHNALDKAVGRLFLKNQLAEAIFLVLSSRVSYELVQKAARARIQIIFSISRPTSLAVKLAERLNITLACLAKPDGLDIFCGTQRLEGIEKG